MITRSLCVLALSAAAAFAQSSAPRCTSSSLRGTYGFTAQGFTIAGSPVPAALQGPFASLGTATYDGRGKVSLTATATFNGFTQALGTVNGTYIVNDDCTFTSKLDNGATFFGSIADNGQELDVIQTNTGVIASGIASLQTRNAVPEPCQNIVTRGPYAFISQGTGAPPTVVPPAAGALHGVGTVAFNSNGTFNLKAVRSANGNIDPQPLSLTGSYNFTQACEFQMTFDVVGFHFNAIVVNGGKEIFFLENDPGTTFIVKAKRNVLTNPISISF